MTFIFQSAQNVSLKIKMHINIGVEKQNFCVFVIKIQDVVGTPNIHTSQYYVTSTVSCLVIKLPTHIHTNKTKSFCLLCQKRRCPKGAEKTVVV